MKRIVWLASYPKSGNTWTRVFLTNYLRNCAEPALVNELDTGPIATNRIGFDETVGIAAARLPPHIVSRLRPEVYRMLARESSDLLFVKVHDAWRLTDRGTPIFPPEVTAAVIYLLRNPLDVAVSFAHHTGRSTERAVARLCGHQPSVQQRAERDGRQLPQDPGTWSEHVRSWVDDSGLPLTLVRYEDLRADPHRWFGKMVDFIGLPPDSFRLDRSVDFSRLEELQRQESEFGFKERPLAATASFFRKGEVNSGQRELAPELVETLTSMHGDTMQRFGYLQR